MQKIAMNNIIKKVRYDVKRLKNTELNVGDYVRVKMTAISNSMRKMEKAGKEKLLPIKYSPMIFRVVRKHTPRSGLLQRSTYYIKDLNGRSLYTRKRLTGFNTVLTK
jgi:hypothetical protein